MSSPSSLIATYLEGPALLRRAVAGMSRQQLTARPVAGKWSTLEVVCHLADSDQVWAHRMKRVIAENKPLLIGYDETCFTQSLGYQERDPEEALAYLEATRRELAWILKRLPAEAFTRTGVHSEAGLVTLAQMLQIECDHIPHHIKFIEEKRHALGV